jgi:hypothetical protein
MKFVGLHGSIPRVMDIGFESKQARPVDNQEGKLANYLRTSMRIRRRPPTFVTVQRPELRRLTAGFFSASGLRGSGMAPRLMRGAFTIIRLSTAWRNTSVTGTLRW